MRKSLLKQIAYLIGGIFVVSSIALATIANFSIKRSRDQIQEENINEATIYANMIEARLYMSHEHLYNLALNIFDNYGIYGNEDGLSMMEITKICEEMDRNLLVSSDLDVLFAYDTITDQRIIRASERYKNSEFLKIKNEIFDYCVDNSTSSKYLHWRIVTINGIDYFYESLVTGKYRVGFLSAINNFADMSNVDFIGDEVATFIKYDGQIYHINGDKKLASYIDSTKKFDEALYSVNSSKANDCSVPLVAVTSNNIRFWQSETLMIVIVVESIISLLLVILLYFFTKKQIQRPLEILLEANQQLSEGNLAYRLNVEGAQSQEFANIYQSYNTMVTQIGDLKIESYEMRLKEEENKLRMFRAQVKPHTFLNGVTTISNMTYTQKPEQIRDYINAFAKFTRYMLHTTSEMTTIANELQHIENYLELQRKKSVVNINLNVICEDAVKEVEIPFLMLYSLVENSIKHSLTPLQDMDIYLQCKHYETDDFKGTLLIEEDNGKGFTEEKLAELTNMEESDDYTKEHLGLTNVKYTLKLLYKRSDLLKISNNLDGGARIAILIPEKED